MDEWWRLKVVMKDEGGVESKKDSDKHSEPKMFAWGNNQKSIEVNAQPTLMVNGPELVLV
jgi:hypothetical protein